MMLASVPLNAGKLILCNQSFVVEGQVSTCLLRILSV